MKKQVLVALTSVAVGVASLVAVASSAAAQVTFPKLSRGMSTWMARAMDRCNPATATVLTSGSPPTGCLQTNVVTDDELLMQYFLKLKITPTGKIVLNGKGFTLGDVLRVRLTLRVTKNNVNTQGGPASVTFPDITVDCPKPPDDGFAARPSGWIVGRSNLAACLAPHTGLTGGDVNIEIVDVAAVNAQTGRVVAVPGLVR